MKNHLELFSGTHSFGKISSKQNYKVFSLDRDMGAICPFDSGYESKHHFKEDIMTFNYKQFPQNHFNLITASPVCLWWSNLRNTWVGRKMKSHGDIVITKEILEEDMNNFGKPMVDKVFEIIEYFKPDKWIIENPKGSKMKHYIEELYPQYNNYKDADYCKYSDWGYKKSTRFWLEGISFIPLVCEKDCDNMIDVGGIGEEKQSLHKDRMGTSKTINDNGKIIRVNTAILRKKYKDYPNLQKHKKCVDGGKRDNTIGKGSTKNERYRIPPKLIEALLKS